MNEEEQMAKYIVYGLDGDPEMPMLCIAANNTDMGPFVLTLVENGNPYYAFESLPMEILMADAIGCNFNGAPLASTDYQSNRINVAAQYASPVAAGATDDGTNKVWVVA
jgi:hypothetical protein